MKGFEVFGIKRDQIRPTLAALETDSQFSNPEHGDMFITCIYIVERTMATHVYV